MLQKKSKVLCLASTDGVQSREAAIVLLRGNRPARFVKLVSEASSLDIESTGGIMEDTEDAQDAWTKPATTFKIKRTKSIGRPSFSNISKQSFTSTSNSVKRMNPFGMVSSSK